MNFPAILAELSAHPGAGSYFWTNHLVAWGLVAVVFWLLGLFVGWLIWRNCRAAAEKIEEENRQLAARLAQIDSARIA